MPYSGPEDKELPDNVKKLPEKKRSQWVAIWNSVYENCIGEGNDSAVCETRAFQMANGKVMAELAADSTATADTTEEEEGDITIERPVRAFLVKLRELLKSKVKDGDLSEEDFNEAVRKARAHAGGVARASKKTASDGWQLFVEVKGFSEPPLWIPYLPIPGTYRHSRYGDVKITSERNQNFVKNFRDGVYQSKLPLDAEHESKLSGAVGWITDMRVNSDGSVDAKVEWTDRGAAFIEKDRFKYVSPEWFDEWVDPLTGEKYKDVAIGGALTTRPFFKDKALRPLVASEGNIFAVGEEGLTRLVPVKEEKMTEQSVGMTEEQLKKFNELQQQFAEMQTQFKAVEGERDTLKKANEQLQSELRTATERLDSLERAARHKRFSDEVNGKVEGGVKWVGEAEKHVKMLEKLADTFGEDSDEVKQYIESNRSTAAQLRQSSLFREVGRDGVGDDAEPASKLASLVNARVKEKNVSRAQAYSEILSEHPELYDEYRKSVFVRVGS